MAKKKKPKLDLGLEEEKEPSFMTKLKAIFKKQGKRAPLTFNVGIAVILFLCYLSIIFVSLPTQPQLLFILIPTLYILVRYIQLERRSHE